MTVALPIQGEMILPVQTRSNEILPENKSQAAEKAEKAEKTKVIMQRVKTVLGMACFTASGAVAACFLGIPIATGALCTGLSSCVMTVSTLALEKLGVPVQSRTSKFACMTVSVVAVSNVIMPLIGYPLGVGAIKFFAAAVISSFALATSVVAVPIITVFSVVAILGTIHAIVKAICRVLLPARSDLQLNEFKESDLQSNEFKESDLESNEFKEKEEEFKELQGLFKAQQNMQSKNLLDLLEAQNRLETQTPQKNLEDNLDVEQTSQISECNPNATQTQQSSYSISTSYFE